MQIQVNTDNQIQGSENLEGWVQSTVEDAVANYADRITRIEVHLGDENSAKGGDNDKRCMMEARLNGLQPIAVTHQAESLQLAVDGAADKLDRAIGNTLGKLEDRANPQKN